MKVLVTGANGFVGSYLSSFLESHRIDVIRGVREASNDKEASYGNLENWKKSGNLKNILTGVDVVIHCAARVHVMDEKSLDPYEEFRKINFLATKYIADECVRLGIKKFIFLSTIKVNGEESSIGKPFLHSDCPSPKDAYGQSKLEAENYLRRLTEVSALEVSVVRPPLIYGPNTKGNILRLLKFMENVRIVPLGNINNKRSLISLRNLSGYILQITKSETLKCFNLFLVSDGRDLSTSEIVKYLALSKNIKVLILPIPVNVFCRLLRIVGKKSIIQRLFGYLQVDTIESQQKLNWTPESNLIELFKEI